MRRFVAATVVLLVAFAIATAEEFSAIVTKFEDGKVTFRKFAGFKKGDKKPEEMTLALADNAKILKGRFDKEEMKIVADGALEGGKEALAKRVKDAAEAAKKKDADKKDDEKKKKGKGFGFGGFGGVFAGIVTEGEGASAKIVEIRVTPPFGGKKKDGQ